MEKVVLHDGERKGQAKILLGRHAKAYHNLPPDGVPRFAGGRTDSDLTDSGRNETEGLARELLVDGGIDLIVHSTMKRTRQTSEIIARIIEEVNGQEVPLVEIKDLEEVDFGDFTGKSEKEARAHDVAGANAFFDHRLSDWNFPGGEDYQRLRERVKSVIRQLHEIVGGKGRILVIGHGAFNRVILHEVANEQREFWEDIGVPHNRILEFYLPGGEVDVVEVSP